MKDRAHSVNTFHLPFSTALLTRVFSHTNYFFSYWVCFVNILFFRFFFPPRATPNCTAYAYNDGACIILRASSYILKYLHGIFVLFGRTFLFVFNRFEYELNSYQLKIIYVVRKLRRSRTLQELYRLALLRRRSRILHYTWYTKSAQRII